MHSRSFLWWLIYTIPILAEAFIFMIFSPQIPGKNIPSQLALCLFFVEVSWLMFLFLHCCRFPLRQQLLFFVVAPKKSGRSIHEQKISTFFHPTNHHPSNHPTESIQPSQLPTIPGRWLRVRPARPSVWWIPSVWLLQSGAGLSMRWVRIKLWENLLFF